MSVSIIFFLSTLVIVIPILAYSSSLQPVPPQSKQLQAFLSSIIFQLVLSTLGLWVWYAEEIALYWLPAFDQQLVCIIFFSSFIGVSLQYLNSKLFPKSRVNALFETSGFWLTALKHLVFIVAAISEEFLYRELLYTICTTYVDGFWFAAFITAIVFSAGHIKQGFKGLLFSFLIGLLLQLSYSLTHSLLAAGLIHYIINVSADWLNIKKG